MKTKTVKLTLNNFAAGINTNKSNSVLPATTAKVAYNFAFESGALTSGLTFAPLMIGGEGMQADQLLTLPQNFHPVRCFFYKHTDPQNFYKRADKLVFVSQDYRFLELSLPQKGQLAFNDDEEEIIAANPPLEAVNYRVSNRDVLLMTFDGAALHMYDASNAPGQKLSVIHSAPKFRSMCVHYERLFTILENKKAVYFSPELNPTAWNISLSGAGYIQMVDDRGDLLKVFSFNGYVYIFREYGIARLTAHGNQTEFNLQQIYQTSGRIYEDTIAICGDRILFLAQDGLYSFDGYNARKINMGIEEMFKSQNNQTATGMFFQGKYYLACKLNFFDDKKVLCEKEKHVHNAVVVVDLKNSSLSVTRGVDVLRFSLISQKGEGQLVACLNTPINQVFSVLAGEDAQHINNMPKFYSTKAIDLNEPAKQKTLKEVKLRTKTPCRVTVQNSDGQESVIYFSGGTTTQTVRTNLRGQAFVFIITTDQPGAEVEMLEASFTLAR